MQPLRNLFNPTATRRLMGLLLLAFLLSHGPGSALRQVLGSTHRHEGDRHEGGQPAATVAAIKVLPAGLVTLATALASRWQRVDGRADPPARQARQALQARPAWQAWQPDHPARSHTAGRSAPAHRHDRFERHGHDIADGSVIALDDGGAAGHRGGDGLSAAAGAGAELPTGLPRAPSLAALAATITGWPRAPSAAWQNALARLPDRPPRA